jgi:hypothetical protein
MSMSKRKKELLRIERARQKRNKIIMWIVCGLMTATLVVCGIVFVDWEELFSNPYNDFESGDAEDEYPPGADLSPIPAPPVGIPRFPGAPRLPRESDLYHR